MQNVAVGSQLPLWVLCYNITILEKGFAMPRFTSLPLRPTLLTRSAFWRLCGVTLLLVLLWGVIRWATLLP